LTNSSRGEEFRDDKGREDERKMWREEGRETKSFDFLGLLASSAVSARRSGSGIRS
jgi:hypothetical protein